MCGWPGASFGRDFISLYAAVFAAAVDTNPVSDAWRGWALRWSQAGAGRVHRLCFLLKLTRIHCARSADTATRAPRTCSSTNRRGGGGFHVMGICSHFRECWEFQPSKGSLRDTCLSLFVKNKIKKIQYFTCDWLNSIFGFNNLFLRENNIGSLGSSLNLLVNKQLWMAVRSRHHARLLTK